MARIDKNVVLVRTGFVFFFQAEDGIRYVAVTGVQTCALPISRFHVHFTPTYGSWLNLVERWFAELTTKQIRRGAHRSVSELERAIGAFLDAHNTDPHPFAWTKSADQILASIARFAQGTTATQAAQLMSRTTVTGH